MKPMAHTLGPHPAPLAAPPHLFLIITTLPDDLLPRDHGAATALKFTKENAKRIR